MKSLAAFCTITKSYLKIELKIHLPISSAQKYILGEKKYYYAYDMLPCAYS